MPRFPLSEHRSRHISYRVASGVKKPWINVVTNVADVLIEEYVGSNTVSLP
jgi:hypothetical protein